MKKVLFFIQLTIILLLQSTPHFGQGVENDWVMFPNIVEFNISPPLISSLPNVSPPYQYDKYTDSNGAFDENGNLLFYIVDSEIYDNTSTLVGLLLEANSGYSLPIRETNIVPVPGNNNQYYVIYSRGRSYEGQDLLYATIECTNGTCTILNNANLLSHYVYGNNNGIAVSRLFSDNTRRMYLASNDFIKWFQINSTGITFQENILEYPNSYGLASWDFDAFQLELSNDCSKLAWGSVINMTVRTESDLPELNIVELDSDGHFSDYYSVLASDENFEPTWYHTIKGVEFASDNSKVYFNVSDGDRTGGIFCYNFDSELLSNVIYDEYNVTQLQSDANGYIYAVSNDGDDIGKIDPATNTITTDYLDIDVLSTTEAGGWFLYTLPDLIDYNSIMALSATSTYESCASESDGTATVTVTGGVPPYTYLWDDPETQTTPTAIDLAPGTYTCTVTDAFNTSISISVDIVTDPSLFTHIGDWDVYTLDGIYGFAAIDGTIEIFDGGTFIIDGNIEFNENSGIIVHNGGVLNIYNNSVLSGLTECNNNYWAGVSIEEQGTIIADIDHFTISKGNMIIEAGAEVSFSANTVYLESNTLIVKQEGKLVLNNNTLTTVAGKTWQGIQVWGNKNEHQFEYEGHPLSQGKLILKKGTTIENAIVAVDLWEPGNWSSTGGMVYADSAIFRNNAKSLHALYYKNYHPFNTDYEMEYFSNFKNCTFEITQNYNNAKTFYKHVDLASVWGIDFQGCVFRLEDNVAGVSQWNSAIASYDAGFAIKGACEVNDIYPCPTGQYHNTTFGGFHQAIHSSNGSNVLYQIFIRESEFTNNGYGIYFSAVNDAVVVGNKFRLGTYDECNYDAGEGIYLDNCKRFAIEDNTFKLPQNAPPAHYVGIHTINTNNAFDEIYKNDFDDMIEANRAEGKNFDSDPNFGLDYYCNTNQNNSWDFVVEKKDGIYYNNIQLLQGSNSYPAGNTFSTGATKHFYNNGDDEITYYHENGNASQTPTLVYRVNPEPIQYTNTCPTHYGGGGDIRLSNTEYQQRENDYNSALAPYNTASSNYDAANDSTTRSYWADKMAYYNMQMARAAYDIIRSDMADTVSHPDKFKTWMTKLNTYASAEAMVDYYLQQGDYTTALNKVDSLPDRFTFTTYDSIEYPMYKDFKHLQSTWLSEGRTIFNLNTDEINSLIAIADSSKGTAGAQARGILLFAYDTLYSYVYCTGLPGSSNKSAEINNGSGNKNSGLTVSVKPNPAGNSVTFNYALPDNCSTGVVELYDNSSKSVKRVILTNNGTKTIDCSALPSGIYFYRFIAGNTVSSGKLVIKH